MRSVSLKHAWFRRVVAVGIPWLATLMPVVGSTEIHVSTGSAQNSDAAALVLMLQDQLSQASSRTAALDARVTVGAAAFGEALASDDRRPLIGAFLTSTEFEAALGERERPPYVSAVFSNPDPFDQVALARTLLGRAALAVFDSPDAHSLATRIIGEGVSAIPAVRGQKIDSLLRAAGPFDAIIVLPDAAVLNTANINHVVRTLYQRRKVLIGYSAMLAHAGGLASVYVSPEATARAVADMLDQYAAQGSLPEPMFVSAIDVALNDRLALSLNIALPDREHILQAIRTQRQQRRTP